MITLFISLIIAFLVVVLVMPKAIPFLHSLKFGQEIRKEGPDWHQVKSGTPTMGGIVILLAMIGSLLVLLVMGDLGPEPSVVIVLDACLRSDRFYR